MLEAFNFPSHQATQCGGICSHLQKIPSYGRAEWWSGMVFFKENTLSIAALCTADNCVCVLFFRLPKKFRLFSLLVMLSRAAALFYGWSESYSNFWQCFYFAFLSPSWQEGVQEQTFLEEQSVRKGFIFNGTLRHIFRGMLIFQPKSVCKCTLYIFRYAYIIWICFQ